MKIVYRLSDNGYPKEKFEYATKEACLRNCIASFPNSEIHLLVDTTNIKPNTRAMVDSIDELASVLYYIGGSSAASWRYARDYALSQFDDDELVLFSEDDYLYLPEAESIIPEGLEVAHYVTPYLNGDRFISPVRGGSKHAVLLGNTVAYETYILKTKSTFWSTVEATTMTFATSVAQLKNDAEIWDKFTVGSYPQDYLAFLQLTNEGRSLIIPIPTLATHCEPRWQAPLLRTGYTSWNEVVSPRPYIMKNSILRTDK